MHEEHRSVKDHEEWTRIVENADGIYVLEGFVALDPEAPEASPERLINDQETVEDALEGLRDELGWGPQTMVADPLTTLQPHPSGAPGPAVPRRVAGGWWILAPVGYARDAHDQDRLEFRTGGGPGRSTVVLWAWEAHEKRLGKNTIPEFGYTVEYALKDGIVYFYDDHPDSPEPLAGAPAHP